MDTRVKDSLAIGNDFRMRVGQAWVAGTSRPDNCSRRERVDVKGLAYSMRQTEQEQLYELTVVLPSNVNPKT